MVRAQCLRSRGGCGSLPGEIVSESRQRPSRPWTRTSPSPQTAPTLLGGAFGIGLPVVDAAGAVGACFLHGPALRVQNHKTVVLGHRSSLLWTHSYYLICTARSVNWTGTKPYGRLKISSIINELKIGSLS